VYWIGVGAINIRKQQVLVILCLSDQDSTLIYHFSRGLLDKFAGLEVGDAPGETGWVPYTKDLENVRNGSERGWKFRTVCYLYNPTHLSR
jgi:hypothetical protein